MSQIINNLIGEKVTVHWHLRKKMFSVTHKGLVVSHVDQICLHNVVFRVRPGGRKRVLESGVKNVHAFVCGTINFLSAQLDTDEPSGYSNVGYNPFKSPYFRHRCNGRRVRDNVDFAVLWNGGIYV